jgi:DNA adenine methylase
VVYSNNNLLTNGSVQQYFPMEQWSVADNFWNKKVAFLNNYKSLSDKTKYKRYIGSPLRYAGGKSLAVGTIVELLPDNINQIISPFFGGGFV